MKHAIATLNGRRCPGAVAVLGLVLASAAVLGACKSETDSRNPRESRGFAEGPGTAGGQWQYLGGDSAHTRYSPADQIDGSNFEDLEETWIWDGASFNAQSGRSTPSYINGKLYTVAGPRRYVIALDPASTEFFKSGYYVYEGEGKTRSKEEQAKYLAELASRYPIASIEDGMAEDDFDGWKLVTDLIGNYCQLVGDDLMVTNVERLNDCIKQGIGNSILVKVNQIGTLTEALAAVETAHKAGYTAVMSHRSGETEDATIADLAVATNCGQIKTGSLARSDRTAKYNQLLRIEQELGAQAKYLGKAALKAFRRGR